MYFVAVDIAGEADFVVFMTDYDNYAGIFTCQKILFGHTKSASILSRKPTLDKVIVNQVKPHFYFALLLIFVILTVKTFLPNLLHTS